MDATDRQLVFLLQQDSRLPNAQLAEKLNGHQPFGKQQVACPPFDVIFSAQLRAHISAVG